jgi:excinuclease UvrABC nuclease subunit
MNGWYDFLRDIDKVPTSEGVYLLAETASEQGIVYAGRADNLRERLSQHPDPNNPCLQRKNIRFFSYEVTTFSESRERALISRYNPECNRT